jgi:hypothetical protein
MGNALKHVDVLVMIMLRILIIQSVRVAVGHIHLWNFVVPHLVSMIVNWCHVKTLSYVNIKHPDGCIVINFLKDTNSSALIAGLIEVN